MMARILVSIIAACCLIIINEVCSTTAADDTETTARLQSTTVVDCRRALDVVFLVDSSSDVTDTDWKSSLDLVTHVSSQLRPSLSGTHVGVMMFATNASTVQHLSHQLLTVSNRTRTSQRGRDLAAAVLSARSLMFSDDNGDRPEVPDVLIIIAHRASDDAQLSLVAAERLKSDGIRIITVGIGTHSVDELKQELRSIATYPRESDRLISVHDQYQSTVLPGQLLQAICRRAYDAEYGSLRWSHESATSGRLETFILGEWVTVSNGSWTHLNTDVACRELGFPGGVASYTVTDEMYSPSRRTELGNITCVGNESRLIDCPHDPPLIDSSSSDRRDVFLRCLCARCNDYRARDNLRLADGGSTHGRLEVFSPKHRWGGVCRIGWSFANTRVACRQLGFLDGARTYNSDDAARRTVMALSEVSCVGNESSLFDCTYHTMSTNDNCSLAVNVFCRCDSCLERQLFQSPRDRQARTGSSVEFKWKLNNNTSGNFEFWFLSRKNRRLVLRRTSDVLTVENTELQERVVLIGDNETTVGFRLANVTRTDMGIYALHVPQMKLFNSQAILFVTDFAVVSESVVHRQVYDSVTMSWDLTALRQLRHINHDILLTTPATGRLHLDFYYSHWLIDNPRRHSIAPLTDLLHPTIIIDNVSVKDAGNYVIEVMLASPVHQWLNASWQFTTLLVVDNTIQPGGQSVIVIVLAVLLTVLSVFVCGLLVREGCRRCRSTKSVKPNQANQRSLPHPSSSSGQGHSTTSRRYGREAEVADNYEETETYREPAEMSTLNNDSSHESESRTIDINIEEEPQRPVLPPRCSTQMRRISFANSSRRAR